MANEISISALMSYSDASGSQASLPSALTPYTVSVGTQDFTRQKQLIGTSDTALNLGSVATLGFVMLQNLDPVNTVNIKTAAGGTIIGSMKPGETWGPCRIGSGVVSPALIALVASCMVDVFIIAA
jgi:hypothetical protein